MHDILRINTPLLTRAMLGAAAANIALTGCSATSTPHEQATPVATSTPAPSPYVHCNIAAIGTGKQNALELSITVAAQTDSADKADSVSVDWGDGTNTADSQFNSPLQHLYKEATRYTLTPIGKFSRDGIIGTIACGNMSFGIDQDGIHITSLN